MSGLLSGKIAVITGGGGAMGGAQSSLFASEDASVCVADVNLEKAEDRSNLIIKNGGKALIEQKNEEKKIPKKKTENNKQLDE